MNSLQRGLEGPVYSETLLSNPHTIVKLSVYIALSLFSQNKNEECYLDLLSG